VKRMAQLEAGEVELKFESRFVRKKTAVVKTIPVVDVVDFGWCFVLYWTTMVVEGTLLVLFEHGDFDLVVER
jgi:hypothetical protein